VFRVDFKLESATPSQTRDTDSEAAAVNITTL
jgi:hypothetical protein